jgi:hypothetical protein
MNKGLLLPVPVRSGTEALDRQFAGSEHGPTTQEDPLTGTGLFVVRSRFGDAASFQLQMAYVSGAVLAVSVVGCRLTSVSIPDVASAVIGFTFVLAAIVPLLFYLREKKRFYLVDSILTILWAFFLFYMLPFPATIAARMGRHIDLQDSHFLQWDSMFGISAPKIIAWVSQLGLGGFLFKTYFTLFPLMQICILLPILTGKVKRAQQFLTAIVAAFAIGLPLFAFLPAIGPWYGFHLLARPDQEASQALLLLIRRSDHYLYQYPSGIICFPSFHVIWAIFCARTLWGFPLLRIPGTILCGLIIFSTLSTGEHYFCDLLAGVLVAVAALVTVKVPARLFQPRNLNPGATFR